MPTTANGATPLDQAGQALRQVLLRLDKYAKDRVKRLDPSAPYAASTMSHVRDIDALMVALQAYEQAATAYSPPTTAPFDPTTLTSAELLAVREADPVYRLGWVRGHQAGVAQHQRSYEPALRLHSFPPTQPVAPVEAPTNQDQDVLIAHVHKVLAIMTERYGAGPLSHYQLPSHTHGTI